MLMRTNKTSAGFTLIEMIVVMLIVALLAGVVIVSINSVTNRRLSAQAEQLVSWLQLVQQSATLNGLHYGIAKHRQNLVAVAPFAGSWYEVVDVTPWRIAEQLSFLLPGDKASEDLNSLPTDQLGSEEEQASSEVTEFNPFVVFSPSGFISPQDKIVLQSGPDQTSISWSDNQTVVHTPVL